MLNLKNILGKKNKGTIIKESFNFDIEPLFDLIAQCKECHSDKALQTMYNICVKGKATPKYFEAFKNNIQGIDNSLSNIKDKLLNVCTNIEQNKYKGEFKFTFSNMAVQRGGIGSVSTVSELFSQFKQAFNQSLEESFMANLTNKKLIEKYDKNLNDDKQKEADNIWNAGYSGARTSAKNPYVYGTDNYRDFESGKEAYQRKAKIRADIKKDIEKDPSKKKYYDDSESKNESFKSFIKNIINEEVISEMSQKQLDTDYEKYYAGCKKNNKKPVTFDKWKKTIENGENFLDKFSRDKKEAVKQESFTIDTTDIIDLLNERVSEDRKGEYNELNSLKEKAYKNYKYFCKVNSKKCLSFDEWIQNKNKVDINNAVVEEDNARNVEWENNGNLNSSKNLLGNNDDNDYMAIGDMHEDAAHQSVGNNDQEDIASFNQPQVNNPSGSPRGFQNDNTNNDNNGVKNETIVNSILPENKKMIKENLHTSLKDSSYTFVKSLGDNKIVVKNPRKKEGLQKEVGNW